MELSRTTSMVDARRSAPQAAAEGEADADSEDDTEATSGVPDVTLRQLRDGDVRAFEIVFRRYYAALYNFAYQYVRSRDIAEELVQDVFCRLWERRRTALPETDKDDGVDAVRAYLYRSVRNAALNWLRHQQVEQRLYDAEPHVRPPGMGVPPLSADAAVHSEEMRTLIEQAVATLPEPYREVLALRSEHELSYPEIAEVLQIPLKTVESRVTRAFRALRETLRGLR